MPFLKLFIFYTILCLQEYLAIAGYTSRHRYCLSFIFLFIANLGYGQVDTVLTIPTIEVNATTIRNQALGGRTDTWSSEVLQNNAGASIADLLK